MLLLLVFVLFTYNTWWLALVGSLLIILLSFAAWPGRNIALLGLRIPLPQLGVSVLLSLLAAICAWLVIATATREQGILFTPVWHRTAWLPIAVHTLGQALNEEMVLGALMLKSTAARLRRAPPAGISILVALVFSTLHFAFYAFRPLQALNYGHLLPAALLSIFAVGVLRNNLIFSTGNIAYAWAVHFGWNLVFIDSIYLFAATHAELSEPAVFNAIIGSPSMLLLSLIAAGLSFLLLRDRSIQLA